MSHLFICVIGPVQDFIATARRSRDLWYGSWMLSELSKSAAKRIAELSQQKLIFPSPSDPKQLEPHSALTVPNRIVAIVDGDSARIGEEVKKAIMARLDEMRKEAFGQIKGNFDRGLADAQVNDLPEIYWVSVPLENDYSLTRDKAEALMAARKSTRNFAQMNGSAVMKSSLDGNRESVIPEQAYPERNDPTVTKQKKITNLYKAYRARHGERLSGVDLLKRLGGKEREPNFRSTSHMAAVPFLEKIDNVKGPGKSDQLLNEIRDLIINEIKKLTEEKLGIELDGSLVFENRLTDWISPNAISDDLRRRYNEILRKYAGEAKPNPYYAILAADGDNMGKIIDTQIDPDSHRKLSGALSQFAAEVPGIVANHSGLYIYSGGDDVLAYLPLHKVLACATELEAKFMTTMAEFKRQTDNEEDISPSLSIGIVIVHHLEPLSDALDLVREAERKAKKVVGKNGLAITLRKRGGADRTISGKWGLLDKRLNELIDFQRRAAISKSTAYELQELHRILSKTDIPPEGLAKEAMRIVSRKREAGGETVIENKVKRAFKQWIEAEKIRLDELAREMIIAAIFAEALGLLINPAQTEAKEAA